MPAGRLWYTTVQRGGGINKGRQEGKYTVGTQVSPDLEGASLVLFTARPLRHSALSHNAGWLPSTTSACVCSPVSLPQQLERNLPGVAPLYLLMPLEFPLSGNRVENTDNVFDRSA